MAETEEERQKRLAYHRKYYREHREKFLDRAKREDVKAKNRERAARWYHENREYALAKLKQRRKDPKHQEWLDANREKRNQQQRERRAKETPQERWERNEKLRIWEKARYQERAERLRKLKRDRGCARCGERDPKRLEWHHRNPGEKLFGVADMGHRPWEDILAEIAKCDLVCKLCHKAEHERMRLERRGF